ncbi:flagellar hook-basal body complex protein FliE [Thermosulfurimonas marina]|uniref:Flagellar hook-basal body complex protein FliE n=1 Tax=Thermosulfurimonas marina TaxID=2047767 RepID=A0A6H1WUK8_9BACT|nr:flagellar hook-basal body complex protein FliE [Thermosulfurimonas marina]QJA06861.1 flagellar hook-basal body complex protein FliE [Thermosulfurimonas marina]
MKVNLNPLKNFPGQGLEKKSVQENTFGELLRQKIQEVDRDQKAALRALEDLAAGRQTDLTQLTLALTRADLSFKLLLRVRNKVLEAYQEIMRMQI